MIIAYLFKEHTLKGVNYDQWTTPLGGRGWVPHTRVQSHTAHCLDLTVAQLLGSLDTGHIHSQW